MNHFIIYFDISAIVIFIIISLIYSMQNFSKSNLQILYKILLCTGLITTVFDILSVISMDINNPVLFHVTNSIYYLGEQWIAFFFFLYALSPLTRRNKLRRYQKLLIVGPIIIVTVLILCNPINGWLYTYDFATGVYSYSYGQIALYLVSLSYYAHAVYYPTRWKSVYNEHIRFAILNTVFLIGTSVILQFILSNVLCHGFAISLALLQILIITIRLDISTDSLTGFNNRTAFYDEVNSLIYNKIPFVAATVRVADYEVLLATYGLTTISELEMLMGNEIRNVFPEKLCYRLNDDIFSFILENPSKEEVETTINKLDSISHQKWHANGVDISFSQFVVPFEYPEHFVNSEQLISYMIYLQKTRRMRYGIMPVEEFAMRDLNREQDVEHILVEALKNRSLEVYYQPIFDTKKNRFVSAEALIRLNNSSLGKLSPGEFIPIAEKSGLIVQIGEYVIDEVCNFISTHDIKSLGIEYIEVNLSTIDCLQRNFFSNMMERINKYKIDPATLCFEITETASNCAPEIFTENLNNLREAGFKLALDDFGTGYGNLQRLVTMEFDIVKFDNNTTKHICEDPKLKPVYNKMVTMIHSMNAKIVAEGVEALEQFDFLSSEDTDYIQGFFFSAAICEEDFMAYIKTKNATE